MRREYTRIQYVYIYIYIYYILFINSERKTEIEKKKPGKHKSHVIIKRKRKKLLTINYLFNASQAVVCLLNVPLEIGRHFSEPEGEQFFTGPFFHIIYICNIEERGEEKKFFNNELNVI